MSKHRAGQRHVEEPGEPVGTEREARGTRAKRLRRKQRRSLALRVVAGVVTGVVAATLAGGGLFDPDPEREPGDPGAGRVAAEEREPITTLVFGTREKASRQSALWLMLFNFDPVDRQGAAVHIPAHTAAEVPGRGLETLESSYASGGLALLLVSVENLLGIELDQYLELSDHDARVLFQATGPITVDLPEDMRVPVGNKQERLLFSAGRQDVTAQGISTLLFTRGTGTDDVDFGSRHLAFWDGLFDRFDNAPDELASAFEASAGAVGESDATPAQLGRFFASLADLPRVAFTITTLPVTAVAAGDDELYSTDASSIREFVTANLGERRDEGSEIRVQILNGNGAPGIGEEVAERLVGEGYRVILSGNARRLDYKRTLIVTYDGSEAGQALAEQARRLLRVGRIQISAQQQGIVDLTIVVGEDFLTTL